MRLDRRSLLAAAGTGLVGLLGGCVSVVEEPPSRTPTPTPDDTETPTPSPTETETPDPTPTEDPYAVVDIRDFGARVDGRTDDTEAIQQALEIVSPGGTVVFPSGVVGISAHPDNHVALDIPRPLTGVTVRGSNDPAGSETRIKMLGGHPHNQTGIRIHGEGPAPDQGGGLVIRDLVFDGNWSEQVGGRDSFPNAFGLVVTGDGRSITVENCVFENWATNGAIMEADGMVVRNCTFRHNGYGADTVGRDGHGMNAGAEPNGVLMENCLFSDNTGTGIDNTSGKVRVRNSVFSGNQFGVKVDGPSTLTELERCHIDMAGGEMGIYTIPGRANVGTIRLNDVAIENASWPGIDLPSKADLVGDNIRITNCNRDRNRDGGLYVRDGTRLDVGTLSMHGNRGGALHLADATGTIETLIYSDNADGLGEISGVSIGTKLTVDPIQLSLPDVGSVGASIGTHSPQ